MGVRVGYCFPADKARVGVCLCLNDTVLRAGLLIVSFLRSVDDPLQIFFVADVGFRGAMIIFVVLFLHLPWSEDLRLAVHSSI